jgi:predicted nucleotidyltransferase
MLPTKMRKALEKVVKELRVRENVCGVGLFGSWARDDAASSSDIDLLILDKADFEYEHVERVEKDGFLIDLDHVPKKWVESLIPPELDQKLYEMLILYDRDWSLTNTKLLLTNSYHSPDRVAIRTEAHVVESDVYFSRATSAFSREDYQSAYLFAIKGLENILRVPLEIAFEPFSNSHFVEHVEASVSKLGMPEIFRGYLEISRLNRVKPEGVKEKMRLFKSVWNEMYSIAIGNSQDLDALHFTVRASLDYHLNSAFLQGMLMRATDLVDSGRIIEAMHYMYDNLLCMLEHYTVLRSSMRRVKSNPTLLVHMLESFENKNPRSFKNMIKFFDLDDVDKAVASETIERSRKVISRIRQYRKVLIKKHLIRG